MWIKANITEKLLKVWVKTFSKSCFKFKLLKNEINDRSFIKVPCKDIIYGIYNTVRISYIISLYNIILNN